ncbi:hypothetical protein RFI_28066, partial [Reticulomyxa filosa]
MSKGKTGTSVAQLFNLANRSRMHRAKFTRLGDEGPWVDTLQRHKNCPEIKEICAVQMLLFISLITCVFFFFFLKKKKKGRDNPIKVKLFFCDLFFDWFRTFSFSVKKIKIKKIGKEKKKRGRETNVVKKLSLQQPTINNQQPTQLGELIESMARNFRDDSLIQEVERFKGKSAFLLYNFRNIHCFNFDFNENETTTFERRKKGIRSQTEKPEVEKISYKDYLKEAWNVSSPLQERCVVKMGRQAFLPQHIVLPVANEVYDTFFGHIRHMHSLYIYYIHPTHQQHQKDDRQSSNTSIAIYNTSTKQAFRSHWAIHFLHKQLDGILFVFLFLGINETKSTDSKDSKESKKAFSVAEKPLEVNPCVLPPPRLCIVGKQSDIHKLECPHELDQYKNIGGFNGDTRGLPTINMLIVHHLDDQDTANTIKEHVNAFLFSRRFPQAPIQHIEPFPIDLFNETNLSTALSKNDPAGWHLIFLVLPRAEGKEASK